MQRHAGSARSDIIRHKLFIVLYVCRALRYFQYDLDMANPQGDYTLPSELDDEVDDALLPPGRVWAYPCKLTSCPEYGKSWLLRSNFLLHLQERTHSTLASTPETRRAIEEEWRYATDPYLPPRAGPEFRSREDSNEQIWEYSFKGATGKIVNRKGTRRLMDTDIAAQSQQREEVLCNSSRNTRG